MKNSPFKNLNLTQLLKDAKGFTASTNNSYIQTYPEFIKYFDNIETDGITEHHLVIGSHFVYGWMPTIINLKLENKEQAVQLLNKVKDDLTDDFLSIEELELLKKTINNSLVGVSKLLHFINPKKYAIWDSRIYRYLTEKASYQNTIGNPKLYLDYSKGIHRIAKLDEIKKLKQLIDANFDYDIEDTRVIEIIMFETDRKNQSQKKLEKEKQAKK